MKKYKLKKDLVSAKAGDIVTIKRKHSIGIVFYEIFKELNYVATLEATNKNEWLEGISEKSYSIWDLEVGDFYFCILESGEVERFDILDEILFQIYQKDLEVGNVFITEKEAKKELEKRKAIQKIKKYCWENGIETDFKKHYEDDCYFYSIRYSYGNDIIAIYHCDEFELGCSPIGYFIRENAEKILEKFEEELKIILDV